MHTRFYRSKFHTVNYMYICWRATETGLSNNWYIAVNKCSIVLDINLIIQLRRKGTQLQPENQYFMCLCGRAKNTNQFQVCQLGISA